MRIAYLDCASGISGDMTLGALVDAGADLAAIQNGIDSLGLPSCRLVRTEVKKQGFRATQITVEYEPEHKHRHLHHIVDMIDAGQLMPQAKDLAAPQTDKPSAEKPEAGDYQLRMPEGIQLDQALLTSAVPVFQELGLSSDQASKLVPLVTHVQERFQQTQLDQLSTLSKSWAQEARADREIGGKNWSE